ncbi:MAG TPA: efflux RND transporter periplasmic adaptor subunit [Gemmatimonadaceae bacterium]
MVLLIRRGLAFAGIIGVFAACGGSGEAAAVGDKSKNDSTPRPTPQAREGGGGGEGMAGGTARGRGMTSLVLGANDVHNVALGTIELAMAIQGDLKPVEEVPVRARIEGNLEAVNVREGDRVGRGQVMARFDASAETGAERSALADVESAKADSVNAQWNADQSAELFKAGAIPERDLRTSQQALVAANARLSAAKSRLFSARRDLEDTKVLAPTSGVVSVRNVENGEHVSRGASMFTVVRYDVLELEAAVPARFAGDVRPAMPVRFNAGGREMTGRVARVSPTINPANRSVTIYLQLPNAGGALKGNTFATGRIVAKTINGTIVVPTSAVRYGQQQNAPFVYRIANETVEHQPVQLGVVDEASGIVQITSGLEVGDRVIVGNVGAIGRGVKVRIAGGRGDPSSASREGRSGSTVRRDSGGRASRPDSSFLKDSSTLNGQKK